VPIRALRCCFTWVAVLGTREFAIAPASADASFRRYFRIRPPLRGEAHADRDGRTAAGIAVRTSTLPGCSPTPACTRRGARHDLAQEFLLLTDLGARTYLDALDAASAPGLYSDAIDALIRWQLATRHSELPPYDEALLAREIDLFPEWYVGRHLAHTLSSARRQRSPMHAGSSSQQPRAAPCVRPP
jgi:aminoglycoside/choline kinase family phosphotransferase